MELGTFERQLQLMQLLFGNCKYSVDKICDRLGISRRTLYRYLELFRDTGFVVDKYDGYWRIDPSSKFFREIVNRDTFNEEEAIELKHILDGVSASHLQARLLNAKLCRMYDFGMLDTDIEANKRLSRNLTTLSRAIKEKDIVKLCGYKSMSSRTISDRIVEPFQMIPGSSEVQCYEFASKRCKTFKLIRIDEVQVIPDVKWSCERKHKLLLTDAFGFTGTKTKKVVIKLGPLACHLLCEEFPQAIRYLDGDTLRIPVCSFLGLGRFVMGLPEEVDVIENDEFREFLRKKIMILQEKL